MGAKEACWLGMQPRMPVSHGNSTQCRSHGANVRSSDHATFWNIHLAVRIWSRSVRRVVQGRAGRRASVCPGAVCRTAGLCARNERPTAANAHTNLIQAARFPSMLVPRVSKACRQLHGCRGSLKRAHEHPSVGCRRNFEIPLGGRGARRPGCDLRPRSSRDGNAPPRIAVGLITGAVHFQSCCLKMPDL